jgi:hypothetical protein
MPSKLEYDFLVIRCNPAVAVALSLAVAIACGGHLQAQKVHGTPPSVTSPGFGGTGNAPHGLPPSVTSAGFGHFGSVPSPAQHHHRRNPGYGAVYYFPYAYPYVVDGPPTDASYDDDGEQEEGGPVSDSRRTRGSVTAASSNADLSSAGDQPSRASLVAQVDAPPQPDTVLVFKDGHEVEIANYAIVGTTLYDLSQDRRWKIQLSELDLPATIKENDNRGLDFQLPANTQAN